VGLLFLTTNLNGCHLRQQVIFIPMPVDSGASARTTTQDITTTVLVILSYRLPAIAGLFCARVGVILEDHSRLLLLLLILHLCINPTVVWT